jgi:hypothetical protein
VQLLPRALGQRRGLSRITLLHRVLLTPRVVGHLNAPPPEQSLWIRRMVLVTLVGTTSGRVTDTWKPLPNGAYEQQRQEKITAQASTKAQPTNS